MVDLELLSLTLRIDMELPVPMMVDKLIGAAGTLKGRASRRVGRITHSHHDVYDVGMVRKQLYLDERQDEALKRRAKQLGVSEAEVVRRALDAALVEGDGTDTVRRRAAADFLRRAEELSNANDRPTGYRFDRQALHEEDDRFERWHEKR